MHQISGNNRDMMADVRQLLRGRPMPEQASCGRIYPVAVWCMTDDSVSPDGRKIHDTRRGRPKPGNLVELSQV